MPTSLRVSIATSHTCLQKQDERMPVGPVVLGLFLFLVVGSALFQVLNSSMNAGIVE